MNETRERLVVVSVLLLLLLVVWSIEVYRWSGLFSQVASVTIESESKGIFYEYVRNDTRIQIGPLTLPETWYSYNGSGGSIHAGYDLDLDNRTQSITIQNEGGVIADVTLSSDDFSDGTNEIDAAMTGGRIQIYIPSVGWKNLPDENEDEELCVANDLDPMGEVTGLDLQVKAPIGLPAGNYTGQIYATFYENESYSPCTGVGVYVTP